MGGGYLNFGRFGASSTLLDGLISWWQMDEASGTRVDAHGGGNNLTVDNTSVGSGTGHVHALAADFDASTDMLECASAPYAGNVGTIALWAKADALQSNDWVFNIGTEVVGASDMDLFVTSTGSIFQFRVDNDGGPAVKSLEASNIWNCIICDWTATVGRIFVNGVQGSDSSGSYAGIRGTAGHTIRVGNRWSGNSQFWDGLIGPMAICIGRRWTADERAEFFAGGAGMAYPG